LDISSKLAVDSSRKFAAFLHRKNSMNILAEVACFRQNIENFFSTDPMDFCLFECGSVNPSSSVLKTGGKKSVQNGNFIWVNTILGNFKNSITGTCRSLKFGKYVPRYLGEFRYRFNRRFKLGEILIRLVATCAQPRSGRKSG
jgi:hypothetical protein